MKQNTVCLFVSLILFVLSILAPGSVSAQELGCATLDFETVPGVTVAEGVLINTQFQPTLGMSFILEDGTFPRIAEVGMPTTAFEPSDTPEDDQGIGNFFLTDDGFFSTLNKEFQTEDKKDTPGQQVYSCQHRGIPGNR